MNRIYKILAPLLATLLAIGLAVYYFHFHSLAVLSPHGQIASKERGLIIFASLLSLIVVLPVFAMTIFIARRYREDNHKSRYSPEWDHDARIEAIWWLVPTVLILILSIVTWNSSHTLDPYKPISSDRQPLRVQVVALQWKWLFIYPEQGIASVNYLAIPANRPINFEVTADAPMNSFWIPQLSGQIYAMSGMSTQLHIIADSTGDYVGRSANISGAGFAKMQFGVQAESDYSFGQWVQFVKSAANRLDSASYQRLAQPSADNPVTYYAAAQPFLYDRIVFKTAPDAAPETQL